MADMDIREIKQSKESKVDRRIEDLIGKLVDGSAERGDVATLQSLSAARAGRMKVSAPKFRAYVLRRKTA